MSPTTVQGIDVSMPEDLASPRAKLVYLYLTTNGSATADELRSALDVNKSTVLSITGTLRERGHLERRNGRYELV
ncbi:TrmB family transcriptional regulator [Natronolimnobius sp. AArcel1]|uniref:TrmB family transcriptional regulator n=1 Tax=Natronolimnobius sp. AArcel1 TaxID=1679093 RepID=UPI0013EB415B|nr:TrmB family transcriptional regulator [Natronolimnobius sp. AArcel1]NGM67543.1 TrmB family transcriptional regulator [Natronolimnobius sp. AArcel1]